MEAIAIRLEAIAIYYSRMEAIATGLEAIATRMEAIATRMEAIAQLVGSYGNVFVGGKLRLAMGRPCVSSREVRFLFPFGNGVYCIKDIPKTAAAMTPLTCCPQDNGNWRGVSK